MKKLICIIITTAFISSCNKLLDENPTYLVTNQNAFNTVASAQLALSGCYATLISWNSFGQQLSELMVGASGIAWAQTSGNDQDQLASFTALKTNVTVNAGWTGLYKTIGECNAFINNIEAGSLDEAQKNFYNAQARFLRGLSYFYLIHLWGDVPLRLETITPSNVGMYRTPVADVAAQIIKDWEFSALHLPENSESTQDRTMSVPNRYSALAYLTKLYFLLGSKQGATSTYWSKAKTTGETVLTSGTFTLEPKLIDLYFKSGANFSREIIFQLNASKLLDGMGNRNNWVFAPSNSTTGISWGRFKVNKSFYDYFAGTYPGDPRLQAGFQVDFRSGNGRNYTYPFVSYRPTGATVNTIRSIDYSRLTNPHNATITELNAQDTMLINRFTRSAGSHEGWPYFRKWVDTTAAAQLSGKNIIVYRYADFLLLMADIYNELGMQGESIALVNRVLARARTGGSTVQIMPADWPGNLDQSTLRDRIFFERLFETAGEPEFYFDSRRRGVTYFRKVLQLNNDHYVTQAFVTNITSGNFRDRKYNNGNLDDNFLIKAMLLPIPQNEINTNDKITDANQNFGY